MTPDTPISALRLMPSKTSEIASFSKGVIESVQSGHTDPIEVLVMLRSFAKASELILDCIKPNLSAETDKYSEKTIEAFGAKIEKAEVGTKYDFSKCGDPTFERLEVDFNKAKSDLDERKEFLKTIKVPTPIGDTVTGELVTVYPPIKTSTSGYKVTLT